MKKLLYLLLLLTLSFNFTELNSINNINLIEISDEKQLETRYVILPFADITQDMIDLCKQTSLETVRQSNLGNGLLSYSTDKPELLKDYTDYSHDEISEIMKLPEWITEIEK